MSDTITTFAGPQSKPQPATESQAAAVPATAEPSAPVDLDALAADPAALGAALAIPEPDAADTVAEKPAKLEIRKPPKEAWVRACDRPDARITLYAHIRRVASGDVYYAALPAALPTLPASVRADFRPLTLRLAATKSGQFFVWPVKPAAGDNGWLTSMTEAVEAARHGWVRVVPDMEEQRQRIHHPQSADWPEPEWPAQPLVAMLGGLFGDRIVRGPDHPLVRELAGIE